MLGCPNQMEVVILTKNGCQRKLKLSTLDARLKKVLKSLSKLPFSRPKFHMTPWSPKDDYEAKKIPFYMNFYIPNPCAPPSSPF